MGFSILIPATDTANTDNLFAIFVLPAGTVAMDFPAAAKPREYVRQEYIEVYQAPWLDMEDPVSVYERDLSLDPMKGKSLIDINGVPALVVEPYSPADDERANPAFLRFVYQGMEFQVSGGDDLETLTEIAESLMATS